MNILSIKNLPAPYSFETHGGSGGRSEESPDCVSVSTVKHYLSKKLSLSNYPDTDFSSPAMKMKSWIGLAFEDRLTKDLELEDPTRVAYPGEFRSPSGRLMMHPDGLFTKDCQIGELGVDEFKHTYSSSAHYDNAEALGRGTGGLAWDYLFQVRSYVAILNALGTSCFEGRLWTFAAVGNWRDKRDPALICAHVSFSQKELDDHLFLLEAEASNAFAWKKKEK